MHKINVFFACFGHHFPPQISPMSRACTGTLLFHNAPIPTNSQLEGGGVGGEGSCGVNKAWRGWRWVT